MDTITLTPAEQKEIFLGALNSQTEEIYYRHYGVSNYEAAYETYEALLQRALFRKKYLGMVLINNLDDVSLYLSVDNEWVAPIENPEKIPDLLVFESPESAFQYTKKVKLKDKFKAFYFEEFKSII